MTTESEFTNILHSFLHLCVLLRPLTDLGAKQRWSIENKLVDSILKDPQILEYAVDSNLREFLHKVLSAADILNQHTVRDVNELERLLARVKETFNETNSPLPS